MAADFEVRITEPPPVQVHVQEGESPRVNLGVHPVGVGVVEVRVPGPPGSSGPPGEPGSPGAQGPPGLSGDTTYAHVQVSAAKDWTIEHNLGKHPAVSVVDSAGSTVIGDVEYVDENTVTLHFSAPFGGSAYLN